MDLVLLGALNGNFCDSKTCVDAGTRTADRWYRRQQLPKPLLANLTVFGICQLAPPGCIARFDLFHQDQTPEHRHRRHSCRSRHSCHTCHTRHSRHTLSGAPANISTSYCLFVCSSKLHQSFLALLSFA